MSPKIPALEEEMRGKLVGIFVEPGDKAGEQEEKVGVGVFLKGASLYGHP